MLNPNLNKLEKEMRAAKPMSVPPRLDEAVFAAYGWKSEMSDEEILGKLLSLNLERESRDDAIFQVYARRDYQKQ